MKKNDFLALAILLVATIVTTASASFPPRIEWIGHAIAPDEAPVRVEVPISSSSRTLVNFEIAGAEMITYVSREGGEIEIAGEGHTLTQGVPSLPFVSRMIAIPARARVEFDYSYSEVEVRDDVSILPTMDSPISEIDSEVKLNRNSEIYNTDAEFPGQLVQLSEPVIMGDLRMVRVTVNPVRYNPVQRQLSIYHNVNVTLRYEDGGRVNTLSQEPRRISRSFAQIYRAHVANFDQLDLEVDEKWGSMLIVTPDNPTVRSYVNLLADWKRRKGMNTVVATLSETGGSFSQIKSFVQNAYNTWEPKLAYLILIGDTQGSVAVPASNSTGDHQYGTLAGNDYLADIAVGRFSCSNTSQLQVEVNKVIGYESEPYIGTQPEWYKKGAVCAGERISGISTIMVNRAIRFRALRNNYIQVDTLWYTMGGSIASFTNNSINSGIGFYNYRGYYGMSGYSNSYINQLSNYHRLPFVVTITCGTGDIVGSSSDYPEEFFRVGTATNPKGAIAAIGTATTGTNTRCNNCVDDGIFGALFDYGIYQFGDALVSSKFSLYLSYPNHSSYVTNYSNWNNLIGDPSCQLWTDTPDIISVTHPDTLPLGSSFIQIHAEHFPTRIPMGGVDVCLYGSEIYETAITDENGDVLFPLSGLVSGDVYVTCTKHNYIPYLSDFTIASAGVFVGVDSFVVDDDNLGRSSGNGDGLVNPGETIELGLILKNYGNRTAATGIQTVMSCPHNLITIEDSTQSFSNLNPLSQSPLTFGYVFSVGQEMAHGETIPLILRVTADQDAWNAYVPLITAAPDIEFRNYMVYDPNNRLDPGDSSPLVVGITNIGGVTASNLEALMVSDNPSVSVDPIPSGFGNVVPQQNAAGDTFIVTVLPTAPPGMPARFQLYFSGSQGFVDTTNFEIVIGEIQAGDPTGPDDYGYWAVDNSDTSYLNRPIYSWVEVDPNHGGAGTLITLNDYGNEQDDTELVNLPFNFFYYGERYTEISVCSNGWLAFGDMTYFTLFRNWPIPTTLGPYAMAAPFWDDLYLTSQGRVYQYYDQANHRFIVEWSRVRNRGSGTPTETFEVILLDPAHYVTPTGDGEIIFLYHTISNVQGSYSDNDYATVGIKSPDNLDGIQYSYWNHYASGAATLSANLAVKFTTRTPINARPPVIVHNPHPNVTQRDTAYFIHALVSSWAGLDYSEMSVHYANRPSGPYNEIPLMPMTTGVEREFLGIIPEQSPGTAVYYYLRARDLNGAESMLPASAPNSTFNFLIGPQVQVVFDDVEVERGWTLGAPGDSATTGVWIREDPVESIADNNAVVQPEDDHTPAPGHICFVTGNADIGAVAGTNDVDHGQTTLISPAYDLSGVAHPMISYWYWYTNDQGNNPGQDDWVVEVSNNNGSSWHTVIDTRASTPQIWQRYQFMLENFCQPSASVKMRFIASDLSPGSLVEACIDDFSIVGVDTTWGNPSEEWTVAAAAKVDIRVEGKDLVLYWDPISGARSYCVYQGRFPDFRYNEGTLLCNVDKCSCVVEQPTDHVFFKIRAVR